MLYVVIILFANALIQAANLTFCEASLSSLIYPPVATIAVIGVDGLFAFLIRALPESLFSPARTATVSERERKFYRRMKIKSWKDKVPELGGFTGFHKNHLESGRDREFLGRFLLESNYGIMIHLVGAVGGFLIAFLPFCGPLSVTVPVSVVNFVLNLLPLFILRYNLPARCRAYKRAK